MLPLSIELARLRLVLIGTGSPAMRRLAWLDDAGAVSLRVFSATPSPELAAAAAERLERCWPNATDLVGMHLVFIADLPAPESARLAEAARRAGALVHVEDVPTLSDMQAPAILRRGDLTVAISTNGASPSLAAELRQFIGGILGPEWQGRVDQLRAIRRRWRDSGAALDSIRQLTASRIAHSGWLKPHSRRAANDRERALNKPGGGP